MFWLNCDSLMSSARKIGEAASESKTEYRGSGRLAAEKSEQARQRTREAIQHLQQQGKPINFTTVCQTAHVSKTFLYDPRHADLAQEIRRLRELPRQRPLAPPLPRGKSEHAKDAQIARLKERVYKLEQHVNTLQQENELLYGKLAALPRGR